MIEAQEAAIALLVAVAAFHVAIRYAIKEKVENGTAFVKQRMTDKAIEVAEAHTQLRFHRDSPTPDPDAGDDGDDADDGEDSDGGGGGVSEKPRRANEPDPSRRG